MTAAEVREEVARVAKIGAKDDESAHYAEDELHRRVLGYIADHEGGRFADMAKAALETWELEFSRWYA